MTGLATGPHLHFEVLIGGEQHNPQTAFPRSSGAPIALAERPAFMIVRDRLLAKVESVPANTAGTLASAIASSH
jgi:murein DD-endopeptidase MepM/ murein hydrolase activator NlpD